MASQREDSAEGVAAFRSAVSAEAGPRGVGMGVAFDWALVAQLVVVAPFVALGIGPGDAFARFSPAARLAAALATVVAALPCAIAGEALRSGHPLMRRLQIAGNLLLALYGITGIPAAAGDLRHAHFGGAVRTVVLLGVSPVIVWLLTRPQTRQWFEATTTAQARARHGGWWIAGILIWALAGGVAIAFQNQY